MPQSDVTQKHTNLGKPSDPTTNLQNFTGGDSYGMTGGTALPDDQDDDKDQDLEDALATDADSEDSANLTPLRSPVVDWKLAHLHARANTVDGDDLLDELDSDNIDADGEDDVSGDMPNPDSDDNMLLNSHKVGLRLDEDEENPQELNIAADMALAERLHHGIDVDAEDDEDDTTDPTDRL